MNREDKLKEHRKWRLWEFLGAFLSIFHFRPWRDLTMGRKIMPRLDREPPLVALDKIAHEGLEIEKTLRIPNSEILALLLDMFKAIAAHDGVISAEEREFVRNFLEKHRDRDWQDDDIDRFMETFDKRNVEDFSLKNSCYLTGKWTTTELRRQIFEAFYNFDYLHDLTPEERRLLDQMGEWMKLSNSEIRFISLRAFRQSKGNA